jgi:hypothetical protein
LIAVIFALLSIQALLLEAALSCHHKRIYLLPAIVGKIAFRTPGTHRQDEDLGTMVFVLHRVANLSRFKLILVEIATTRLIQRRVISYRLLQ